MTDEALIAEAERLEKELAEARAALANLANTPMSLSLEQWCELSTPIIVALNSLGVLLHEQPKHEPDLATRVWDEAHAAYLNHQKTITIGRKDAVAIQRTEARLQAAVEAERSFQRRVQPWMLECFNEKIAADLVERCDRFLEEDLELVQAVGYSADRAHALVDYTFNRPKGDPSQEVGGVMVTLAALCLAAGLDMHEAGEVELTRISQPEIIAKIRTKQAAKPTGSALPVAQAIRNPS